MHRTRILSVFVLAAGFAAGCAETDSDQAPTSPTFAVRGNAVEASDAAVYSPELDVLRQNLRASGLTDRELSGAEILVAGDSVGWDGATTLIANNRQHQINSQFVADDPRRGGGSDITYVVDQSDGSALAFSSSGNISMAAWRDSPSCIAVGLTKVADSGGNIDVIDDLVFGGPVGSPTADMTHGGWLPRAFFNAIAPPNGGSFILGVTFTFIFVDDDGNPTDIDRDGQFDVAFREMYYNRAFGWGQEGEDPRNVDIQSVATHEAGHAYGLAHFGQVFEDNNGTIKYAPRAIMNAVYISPFRELTGSDNSSFCQIWASTR
jgi:hypothetical protein